MKQIYIIVETLACICPFFGEFEYIKEKNYLKFCSDTVIGISSWANPSKLALMTVVACLDFLTNMIDEFEDLSEN